MPSHTFATTDPERLSSTDATSYVAVCLVWRPSNTATFQFDTTNGITNSAGGIKIGSDIPYFWIAIPGQAVRLTELYAAGAVADVVDIICFRHSAVMAAA